MPSPVRSPGLRGGRRAWMGLVPWAFLCLMCSLRPGLAAPLDIGLATSAERIRLTCSEGMVATGEGMEDTTPLVLESGEWLLVRKGRALIVTHSTAFSLISAEGEQGLVRKTAERLRKEGRDAIVEERGSATSLHVRGLRCQDEAERMKGTLPRELREGARVFVERKSACTGSLVLSKGSLSVRTLGGSARREPSEAASPTQAAWVLCKGASLEAAHGVYRGEMSIEEAGGGYTLVNLVEMEEYLKGVVPYEMPRRFALEALKAQAVAARTYALGNLDRHRKEGFGLCAGQHCQVYGGMEAEAETTSAAVEETAGLVMTRGKALVPAFFHSTCGGRTEDASSAWPGGVGSVSGVWDTVAPSDRGSLEREDEAARFLKEPLESFCQESPLFRWQRTYSREGIQKRVGGELGDLASISVKSRTASGRVSQLLIKGTKGERLVNDQGIRWFFGVQPGEGLPSNFFLVTEIPPGEGEKVAKGYVFAGAGWGHGVGMCQYGANGMARRGFDFKSILRRYYDDFTLTQMR